MLTLENDTDIGFDEARLAAICEALSDKDVECVLTDSESMRELNLRSRGLDKTTDVLSFPLEHIPHAPLGSIVINADLAAEVAEQMGHEIGDECALLFIHGMLHLLGMDHECDDGQMREKERELAERFGLPEGLIYRNEG
jgi:probable rRNA maturation factor